jgi:hypothetical protein
MSRLPPAAANHMDSYRLSATLMAAPVHSSSVPHDESTFYITYSFLPKFWGRELCPRNDG